MTRHLIQSLGQRKSVHSEKLEVTSASLAAAGFPSVTAVKREG